jgi:AcrR family transcriptional regulator
MKTIDIFKQVYDFEKRLVEMSKSDRTKTDLADALEQLLTKKSHARISIKQLAMTAGVDRQTFYYHFGTVDDLFQFAIRRKLDSILSDGAKQEDFRSLLKDVVHLVENNKAFFRVVLDRVDRKMMREYLHEDIERLVRHQFDIVLGDYPIDENTKRYAIEYCIVSSLSMLEFWICEIFEMDMSGPELVAFLSDSFTWYVTGLHKCAIRNDRKR